VGNIQGFEVKVVMQKPVRREGNGRWGVRFSAVGEWTARKLYSGILCGKCLLGVFFDIFLSLSRFCFLCYYVLVLYLNKERYSGA
jgi:hypothetical protein